jgi:hypothetical protein
VDDNVLQCFPVHLSENKTFLVRIHFA